MVKKMPYPPPPHASLTCSKKDLDLIIHFRTDQDCIIVKSHQSQSISVHILCTARILI